MEGVAAITALFRLSRVRDGSGTIVANTPIMRATRPKSPKATSFLLIGEAGSSWQAQLAVLSRQSRDVTALVEMPGEAGSAFRARLVAKVRELDGKRSLTAVFVPAPATDRLGSWSATLRCLVRELGSRAHLVLSPGPDPLGLVTRALAALSITLRELGSTIALSLEAPAGAPRLLAAAA